MPYTAKLTRGPNRSFFSVDFRHPVKRDRAGRFGLKVRRGLGTADPDEAARMVTQLNELLADERFHRPTAREAAVARGYDLIVIDAFFRDLEPTLANGSRERDRLLPLPTATEGYASVLLLGTTGSGKSTLIRQFLGTDPVKERFPSTAPGRTTVADHEFVLRPSGDYEAVVSFIPRDLVAARVEDAITSAALAHLQDQKHTSVQRAFLAPREGRFRLSYILGSRPIDATDSDDNLDDGPANDGSISYDSEGPIRESRIAEFVDRLIEIGNNVGKSVAEKRNVRLCELLSGPDRDSAEQDIDTGLRDAGGFTDLVNDVVDEIELRFVDVRYGDYDGGAGNWPRTWRVKVPADDRHGFMLAVRPFTGIAAAQHGSLLTPAVEGIRIAGPFQPAWWTDRDPLRLVLIDGEGVGHSPETLRSLPGGTTDLIAAVDRVLLVDSARQPMLEGPTLVARTLERLGESAKLSICFTNVDQMSNAVNLPRQSDKMEFVRDAAREVFSYLAREFARPHLPELDRALEDRTFFVAAIQTTLGEQARFTRDQLSRLSMALRYSPAPPAAHTSPEYDLDNLVIAIAAAATDYVETYRALVKLPSQRTIRPVAWQTVKAATRYASQFGADGYGTMKPAADFATMLGERLARFLAVPLAFKPINSTDDAKERATANVRKALAKRLDPWIRERLLKRPLPLWGRAYGHQGTGSTRLRALDIDVLNLTAVPPSTEEGDPEATRFRTEVKQLVIDAIGEAGGAILGGPRPDA
jgi:energy-coupling factor transporter ATP-binding protein EcfA2